MKLDLHMHSTFSDGTLEPEDLVLAAQKAGITHMALSDHDSTSGLAAAGVVAQKFNMELVPAIEINTQETNGAVHILGYFLDPESSVLQQALDHHRQLRLTRAEMIVDKLKRMGIRISMGDFSGYKDKTAIGRPHIADRLRELGIVFSRQEAFDKYLAKGRSAYVFYQGPTPQTAIEIILAAKGVPVLAHPGFAVSLESIKQMLAMGLQGLEVYYPSHSPQQIKNFLALAKQYDLIATGGSDYHGPGSGHEDLGKIDVPQSVWQSLLDRKARLH